MKPLWIFILALLVWPLGLFAAPPEIRGLVQSGAVLLLDEEGNELLAYNPDQARVPASIIKLLTSQVMIDSLGLDYRGRTGFYLGPKGELGVMGYGDPFLVSEELALIAQKLKQAGHSHFNGLRLDASRFLAEPKSPGTVGSLNPYDALNGALVVNFNSLFVGRKKDGTPYSAEEVTPLTPIAQKKAMALKPGFADRINLTDQPAESLVYAAELITAIFKHEGINLGGPVSFGRLEGYQLIFEHRNSRALPEMLEGLLKYSNNYIANQLLLILGGEEKGWPADRQKALDAYKEALVKRFGPANGRWELEEASGISRQNRVTARFMAEVLLTLKDHHQLLSKHKKLGQVFEKSGTLTGVYNFAGYIQTQRGLRPFVIILEQGANNRDELLKILANWP